MKLSDLKSIIIECIEELSEGQARKYRQSVGKIKDGVEGEEWHRDYIKRGETATSFSPAITKGARKHIGNLKLNNGLKGVSGLRPAGTIGKRKIRGSFKKLSEGGGTRRNRKLRGQSPAHTDTRGYVPSEGGTSRSHKIFGGSDYLRDREKEGLEAMSVRHSKEITKNSLLKRRSEKGKPSTGYTKGGVATSTIKPFVPRGSYKKIGK